MNEFVIVTDTACDISPEILQKWNVSAVDLTFRYVNEEREYQGHEVAAKEFYDKMREGAVAKTAAINPYTFQTVFEEYCKEGKDILHISFSSGLSTTYNSSCAAMEELKKKYPERKLISVDSLCASAGQGLFVYLAVSKRDFGASIEEIAEYLEGIKLHICHWFTVDDLVYLKRGGRVSSASAFVANALGIKPVLHVDNDGKLVSVSKCRGRKKSLQSLADKYGELADPESPIYISHADVTEDAELLAEMIQTQYHKKVDIITGIGPIIGAHSGPGTIALFFVGKQR